MKFSVPLQILVLRTATWQSIKILHIQNGRRPPYLKSSFGYISAIYCPINAKFCKKKQNHVLTQVTWPKCQILKIQDGGRPPFWKWFYRYISAENHFGMQTQILVPRTVICWFIKKNMKFKMADSHHIENRLFCYISTSYCPIDAIFGMYK